MRRRRDKYERLYDDKKLHGTIARARKLAQQRASANHETKRPRLVKIPLGARLRIEALAEARRQRPRVQNWELAEGSCDIGLKSVWVRDKSLGRYSRRCTWDHVVHVPVIRSCGVCTPRYLLAFLGERKVRMTAPKGWRFGRDGLGLYIVRTSEAREHFRYHFHAADLRNKSTLRAAAIYHERLQIDAAKQERAAARQRREREQLEKLAVSLGVYVGLRDSVSAGNCAVGTRRWAEQHNMDCRRHYPLAIVERFAAQNGHSFQVKRACRAALDRAVEDLQRGYCIVTEAK